MLPDAGPVTADTSCWANDFSSASFLQENIDKAEKLIVSKCQKKQFAHSMPGSELLNTISAQPAQEHLN